MNNDFRYLYFSVLDYTNSQITSGYTLPITPFTFIPKFDAGDNMAVSNTRIIWDFGDGTTSREITATHFYKIPGTYSVKCYFYGASGIGYESSFVQNILVKDFISDTLVLSAQKNAIIRASHYECPFLISRFNSWQTYNSLSSQGASIMLEVSGNSSPLLDIENYFSDKYSHLKASARFLTIDFNAALSTYDPIPVYEVNTIDNKDIYVKLNSNKNIVFCNKEDDGSVLAGTSGQRLVYFTDDTVKTPTNKRIKPVIIKISFDYKNFYDVDNVKYSFKNNYPILNNTTAATYAPLIYYVEDLNCMAFSTNGIDTEGNFDIATFDIGKNKFIGQKIPFVAKAKDSQNFTSKSWKKFSLKNENDILDSNSIKFYLKDNNTGSIIPSAFDVYEDYGEFENYDKLGFFKGHIVPKISATNVRICCDVNVLSEEFMYVDTKHVFLTNPQSVSATKIDLAHEYENDLFDPINTTQNLFDTITLSGMYASIVVPKYENGIISHEFWTIDSDQDLVAKINFDDNSLITIPLSGSSPSFLAADKNGDIWVTLYDSVSVCKLSSNGDLLFYTTPSYTNIDYSSNSFYISNLGAAGSNSILPAIVDIDVNNNAWVVYNFSLSSFICKYDQNGILLNTYDVPRDYIANDIICTYEKISWILLKNKNPNGYDGLLKIDQISNAITFIGIDHKIWSFTHDINNELWFIANESDLLKKPNYTNDVHFVRTLYTSSRNISMDSNFNGIASTIQGDLLIFNNADKEMQIFNITQLNTNYNTATASIIPLNGMASPGGYQDFINSKGDCTGFKYTEKFLFVSAYFSKIGCCSNIFNINPIEGESLAKINENFDMSAQMKNFVLQETLRDSNVLFDDFIKQILGSQDEPPNTLGKKIYEKISNFIDNNNFIDTCNIDNLNSMHKMLNENLYIFNTYNFPSNINRLLNLFSIKLSKLKGSRNKFNENFDKKGYLNSDTSIYGINLGPELDFFNTVLTAGIDTNIIAYERFSDSYAICNTNILTANFLDFANKTYALSSYSPVWGWSLVLPPTYNAYDITKYYTFYEYISTYSNEQIEGIINWNDKFTTISESISSYSDWWDKAENIITRELMLGLELLSSNN